VRALVEHLAAFGGIPLVTVFDRSKMITVKSGRHGVVTKYNPTFARLARDLAASVDKQALVCRWLGVQTLWHILCVWIIGIFHAGLLLTKPSLLE
jgi:hypothetical protein